MKDQTAGFIGRPPVAEADDEIDLLKHSRTLWSGKWLILATMIGFAVAGYFIVDRFVTPLYTARATVALEDRQESVVDLESVVSGLGGDQATIATEVEVLRSRSLVTRVVRALDLGANPAFNPNLDPNTPAVDPETAENIVVDRVLDRLTVSNVRSSYAFQISATTDDPALSAALVNTLADLYTQEQVRWKVEATVRAEEWLGDRAEQLRIELERTEAALGEFASRTTLISTEALEALNIQIKDLRTRLEELRMAQGRAGSEFEADRLARQIAVVEGSLTELNARYERQSADLVTYQQLEREAEASRAIYGYFLTRLKETSVQ